MLVSLMHPRACNTHEDHWRHVRLCTHAADQQVPWGLVCRRRTTLCWSWRRRRQRTRPSWSSCAAASRVRRSSSPALAPIIHSHASCPPYQQHIAVPLGHGDVVESRSAASAFRNRTHGCNDALLSGMVQRRPWRRSMCWMARATCARARTSSFPRAPTPTFGSRVRFFLHCFSCICKQVAQACGSLWQCPAVTPSWLH
jgi:hypothetical protein